jgi:hypothetical protein
LIEKRLNQAACDVEAVALGQAVCNARIEPLEGCVDVLGHQGLHVNLLLALKLYPCVLEPDVPSNDKHLAEAVIRVHNVAHCLAAPVSVKDGAERRKQKPGSPALLLTFNSVGCCAALDTGDDGLDLPHHTRSNATERLVISFKAHWPLDVAGLCQLGEEMWSNHAVAFE